MNTDSLKSNGEVEIVCGLRVLEEEPPRLQNLDSLFSSTKEDREAFRRFLDEAIVLESWACFGSPDAYSKENQAKAVITYCYHGEPSFEIIRRLKAATAKRNVLYMTERVGEDEREQYVIRETGRGCKHSLYYSLDMSTRELGEALDQLRKKQ
ncbi:MAG: hypothetical protein G01um101420_276 [Parcubacteria group bacterium Gr01-1014_20]|nr:MAG: hypothetical protein G01um101420_276 [Parcubacteria group bacterium Gr01-1014_20]